MEGLFGLELAPARARLVNNVTHWAYGMLGGAQYGIVAESLRRPRIGYGLPFGATVWASGYVILPAAKLYKPIWEYDARRWPRTAAPIWCTGSPRPRRCGCFPSRPPWSSAGAALRQSTAPPVRLVINAGEDHGIARRT